MITRLQPTLLVKRVRKSHRYLGMQDGANLQTPVLRLYLDSELNSPQHARSPTVAGLASTHLGLGNKLPQDLSRMK